jgi:hypothetical protein
MARTVSLSLLDTVEIASPCPARWEDMQGDERSRFCGECRLNVYNIAAMTRAEAEALILGKEGRLCARIYRRPDGTVLTRDCPVGLRLVRQKAARAVARIAAAVALLIGGALAIAGVNPKTTGMRLRRIQPFATICEWVSPNRGATMPLGRVMAGEICLPALPANTPPAPINNGGT